MRIGVDLGGTKIEVAALDRVGGMLERRRVPTPGGYGATIRAICDLVTSVETTVGERGSVGVGAPGSISPRSGLIRNANSIWLNGMPLREDLAAALGRPVRVANDANCLALSEATDGAGAGHGVVFAAILGTGCGGGIVVDGRLLAGGNGVAGEWGMCRCRGSKRMNCRDTRAGAAGVPAWRPTFQVPDWRATLPNRRRAIWMPARWSLPRGPEIPQPPRRWRGTSIASAAASR